MSMYSCNHNISQDLEKYSTYELYNVLSNRNPKPFGFQSEAGMGGRREETTATLKRSYLVSFG